MAGLLDGLLGLGAAGLDYFSQLNANNLNQQLVRETNAQNLELTRESWAREDNAVQRRAADLKAAGLNPVLAAGSAASTSGAANFVAPRSEAPVIGDKLANAFQMMRQKQDISQSQAQTDLINKQNDLVSSQKQSADWQNQLNRALSRMEVYDPENKTMRQGADALAFYNLTGSRADMEKKEAEALNALTTAKANSWDFQKAVERNQTTSGVGGIAGQLIGAADYLSNWQRDLLNKLGIKLKE